MNTILITGSSGLVGSECVRHFHDLGWTIYGIDNNAREDFFGQDGSTTKTLDHLRKTCTRFSHQHADIRHRGHMLTVVDVIRPDLIVHCAGQPSHDLAARHPFMDFDTNASGTLNLLEACRQSASHATFIFMSSNKVFGDSPNVLPVEEKPTRWDYSFSRTVIFDRDGDAVGEESCGADPERGISEEMRIDQSTHSLFGCSKLAADVLTQEYGRLFGMKTCCFRAGCLTGGAHAGAEQHGFLAYLAKCCREERPYKVYGYKGKQVRDNLHAYDVARACEEFAKAPRSGAVYNLGGGRENSVSVLEAIEMVERATGKKLKWEYVNQARTGDHICYLSDCSKFRDHYPNWIVTRNLDSIIAELCAS